jgi:phosphocarrier protein HPr
MPSKTVTVGSSVGLHARPAALIAEAVSKSGVPVTLATAGGNAIDAGSPLMIMTLGAKQGTEVTVSSDDDAVLGQIADMVAADLDAD